ncbi:MAG: hypothetical protein IT345_11805 [Trueperaceae bacterium]|nr:hypothetical protein [Trueperaceae bacterium]
MESIIGTIRRYTGAFHRGLAGCRVVIVAVHRGGPDAGEILRDDGAIGRLRPDDVVEFAPLVRAADGSERRSFVTSDARPAELEVVDAG